MPILLSSFRFVTETEISKNETRAKHEKFALIQIDFSSLNPQCPTTGMFTYWRLIFRYDCNETGECHIKSVYWVIMWHQQQEFFRHFIAYCQRLLAFSFRLVTSAQSTEFFIFQHADTSVCNRLRAKYHIGLLQSLIFRLRSVGVEPWNTV